MIPFARLTSVKAKIKGSLIIRNWHKSHQGCDLSSYRLVLANAWTPALDSWSCRSPPASDMPLGFWTQSSAIWPPCPKAYPKQHQGLSLMGTRILISSNVSHWMFTAGGVLKMLSREVFAAFCFRVTCVLFKSWRDKLQLRSCLPWISKKVWYIHSFSAVIIKYRNKSLAPHKAVKAVDPEKNSVS